MKPDFTLQTDILNLIHGFIISSNHITVDCPTLKVLFFYLRITTLTCDKVDHVPLV